MKDLIIKYYGRMRDYLLEANAENADIESITFEVDHLKEEYYNETDENMASTDSEYEEQNAVWGLFRKFNRLHGEDSNFIVRNPESLLAQKMDLGFGIYNPPCPYSEEEFPNIQKNIINYIINRVKTPEDDNSKPLLKGDAQSQLSQKQMKYIVDNITRISQSLTDYVDEYDKGNWNWLIDCRFILQYVFEKAAELTYKVAKGEDTDGIEYDIRKAFSYFQLSVPDTFQMKLDSEVDKLDSIVLDITSYIEKNDYHLCNKLTWFYPMVFDVALNGMFYTLEQNLQNNE